MEEKISIIVPIYNVEKYLEKCINLIINQTYKNLEIILVDDGSLDRSGEIAKFFQEKDERINYYRKENGGISSARNFGFGKSQGQYIIFIDPDDYIDKVMIEELYNQLKKEDADVSCCNVMNVYKNNQSPQCYNSELYYVFNREQFLRGYLIGEIVPGSICNKLLKRGVADKLRFPEGIIYEDAYYHYDLIEIATKFVINTKPRYFYFHRSNSITTRAYSSDDIRYIEIYSKFYKLIEKKYPKLKKEAFFRLSYSYFFILDKMLLDDNFKEFKEYKQVIKFLKGQGLKIAFNNLFRKGRRIASLFLMINVRLYRKILLKNNESKAIS